MATVRIPILGSGTIPDTSGDVFFAPLSQYAPTNDLFDTLALIFNDSGAKDEVNGAFQVPQDYGGSAASIIVFWTADATTGDVVFDFDYNAIGGDDTESYDPSAHTASNTVTDSATATSFERYQATISLTAGNFAAGDTVLFQFGRDGVSASDTLAASVAVVELLFQYDT